MAAGVQEERTLAALGLTLSAIVVIIFVGALKPSGAGAYFFFSVWLLLP